MASTTIPKASRVLITGATGHLGSGIATKILEAGYKVRAVVRNPEKADITSKAYEKRFGPSVFETVLVKDIAAPGALDEALQDCSAVVHTASDISYGTDPQIITNTVAMAENIIKSAAKVPSIKRFVYTSSNQTLALETRTPGHITPASWNDESVEAARNIKADEPWNPLNARHVYSASKVLAERALWKFVEENKPDLVLNTVCPNFTIGANLDPRLVSSTNGVIVGIYTGNEKAIMTGKMVLPQFYVGLDDVGLLHLGCLTLEEVKSERLIGLIEPITYNDVVDVLMKIDPSKTFEKQEDVEQCKATVELARSREVIKLLGKDDFDSLETAISQCLSTLQ